MRQALRRAASVLTPTELDTRVAQRDPVSAERYGEVMGAVARRAAGGAVTGR
ncbi:hypothetical protein BH23ACT2_BH23ACT2_12310 [soil metagenome]